MSVQELKYLRNCELREEIINLTGAEPEKDSWIEPDSDYQKSRPFMIGERRAVARAVIGDVGPAPIQHVIDDALESKIESLPGQDLNAIIDAVVGIGMENHGYTGDRGRARKFRRSELKALLEYLKEQ